MDEPTSIPPFADLKPGWQTSEFWVALCNKVLAIAIGAGVVSFAHGKEIQEQLSAAVIGIFAIISLMTTARAYILSRTHVKTWWYKVSA